MKKYKPKKIKWYNLEKLFNKKFSFILLKEQMKNEKKNTIKNKGDEIK
jgi:hypothetical protein